MEYTNEGAFWNDNQPQNTSVSKFYHLRTSSTYYQHHIPFISTECKMEYCIMLRAYTMLHHEHRMSSYQTTVCCDFFFSMNKARVSISHPGTNSTLLLCYVYLLNRVSHQPVSCQGKVHAAQWESRPRWKVPSYLWTHPRSIWGPGLSCTPHIRSPRAASAALMMSIMNEHSTHAGSGASRMALKSRIIIVRWILSYSKL